MTQLVHIDWWDACDLDSGQWVHVADIEIGRENITTVGHLVYEDDVCVAVSHSIDGSGDARGVFVIPKASITRRIDFTRAGTLA